MDVCAGVGPFVLPLKKTKQCVVYASDLNPYAVECLKRNAGTVVYVVG